MATGKAIMRRVSRHKGALMASLAAVAALGMTASSTLGGFSAGISNSTSTFSSATVQLEESNGGTTCYSTGSGSGGAVTAANTNTTCTINALVECPSNDARWVSTRATRPLRTFSMISSVVLVHL